MPSRKLGGREVREAKEVSESRLLVEDAEVGLSRRVSIVGCISCIVAAILGTFNRFFKCVWLLGLLPKDHRSGKISFGMPPPLSEIRIITCCGASQMRTSTGGKILFVPE